MERAVPGPVAVVELAEVDASWIGLVGGKAAGLGEMIKVGERVAEGFCVTAAAHEAVRASTGALSDELSGRSLSPMYGSGRAP